MAVRVGAVLLGLACLTLIEQRRFASDEALWRAALRFNTGAPRPAFNLGLELRKQGRIDEALRWFAEASDRAQGTSREAEYVARIQAQMFAIEASGYTVCDLPSVRALC